MNLRNTVAYSVIIKLLILVYAATVVGGQKCSDTIGSLRHDNRSLVHDQTFILADREYKVTCKGTVIAWEFCYRVRNQASATFYPSIWLAEAGDNGTMNYTLIRSNNVTFTTPSSVANDSNAILCQTFNLSKADQFIAPAGSVVGLYSNSVQLLRTNKAMSLITTYITPGNKSNIQTASFDTRDIGYNIGLQAHLVPCVSLSDPENGNVTCLFNISVFQYTCTYYCNHGYQLKGNRQTRCNADGTWSSEPVTCTILKCNDPKVEIANSQSVGICNVTYGSSCSLECSSGLSVSGNGEHVCDDVNDEGTLVMWRSVGEFSCNIAGTSASSGSGSSSAIAIIVGSVGGAAFFFIIISLCVVILCVRQSHKKRAHTFHNNVVTKSSADIEMNTDPSYNINKQNRRQENQYVYVMHKKQDTVPDTIKMDSNPPYGSFQGCNSVVYDAATEPGFDITVQPNPTSEDKDQCDYIETNPHSTEEASYVKLIRFTTKEEVSTYDVVTDDTDDVKMNFNPS